MKNTNAEQSLTELTRKIKTFKGFTRKAVLADLMNIIGEESFDDAGAIKFSRGYVVVSTDGIVENLVKADPWLAGFYSVVVNVNDVAAKGATPKGFACVVSSRDAETRRHIAEGIKHGLDKYELKFMKGHTHPDTSFDAVDAAVVGFARKTLSSINAKLGDWMIVAVDLDGKYGRSDWLRTFDSVKDKNSADTQKMLRGVAKVAENGLANACRDISGPGIVGTAAMLCESSRVGVEIDLTLVPKPAGTTLTEWLMTYPSMGFIFATCQPERCARFLESYGFTAHAVGCFTRNPQIVLLHGRQREIFMDMRHESVFGFKRP